jgi:cobaltochelatase CobT
MAEDLKSTTDGAYEDPNWKDKGYKVLSNRWDAEIHVNKPQPYKTRVGDLMANKTSADYEQLKTQIRSHVTTMKSKLRRAISAKEQRDWDFGRSSGRIDSKRLAQAFQGAENVYKKRIDRDELDTAVLVLVDLSGSMGGAKQHTAGLSAIAFAECLEGTQVKYQVSGFSNNVVGSIRGEVTKLVGEAKGSWHRYEPLQVYTFKDFNDKLHPQKGAMAALTEAAGGNNSDTDAIIWAHQKLKKMPQKRKILIVLSDGYPANDDIGNPGSLDTPLKKAAEDVAKDGIECIGIGILSDSCQNLYKNNVRVDNIEELSGVVFTKLSAILMGAKLKL